MMPKETYLKPEITSEVLEPSTLLVAGSPDGSGGDDGDGGDGVVQYGWGLWAGCCSC
jgi:hypothetical protein